MQDNIKKSLVNAEGKRLLEKTKLEYSKSIIDILKNQPHMLDEILDEMQLTQEEFLNYLSGDVSANVSVYDQALVLARKMQKNNKN